MKFIKKIWKKICYISYCFIATIKIVFASKFSKNKIYLVGIPIHGNLGDQAILLAEEKFLKENFKKEKIIEIESNLVIKLQKILPRLVKDSTILVHGGGFLGTLWINEEEMARTVLKIFSNNTIIVLPQTSYFSDDLEGKKVLEESKRIYQNHKNLVICCREQFSYNLMKEQFPLCKIMLIPDMVLYLNEFSSDSDRNNNLYCIRKDKEKVQYDFKEIELLTSKIGSIDYTDTVIEKRIYSKKTRIKDINKKLKQFSQYKLIVTDRLHGMVFALLSKTPCLVLENKSYKVKGVYEWIKDVPYIQLYNKESVETQVEKLMKENKNQYNNKKILELYKPLISLIEDSIENQRKGN